MAQQRQIKVKVNNDGDTRLWRYSDRSDFDGLCSFISTTWNCDGKFIAQYADDEGDLITIASSQDMQDAFASVGPNQKSLKIFVMQSASKPAEPSSTAAAAAADATDATDDAAPEKKEQTESASAKVFSTLTEMATDFLDDAQIVAAIPTLIAAVISKVKEQEKELTADEIAAMIVMEATGNDEFKALREHPLYQKYAGRTIPFVAHKIAAQQALYQHFQLSTIKGWIVQLIEMLRSVLKRPGGVCGFTKTVLDIQYPEKTDTGKVIHYGVQCDVCDQYPIIGDRYKCTVRRNWDCCAACEPGQDHPLIKFKKARNRYGRPSFRRLAALLQSIDVNVDVDVCDQGKEKKEDVVPHEEESAAAAVRCICGSDMPAVVARKAYSDCNTVYCDVCGDQFFNELVFHCPKAKDPTLHANGYDICTKCGTAQQDKPVEVVEPEPEPQPQPEQPEEPKEEEHVAQEQEQEQEQAEDEEEPVEAEEAPVEVFQFAAELDQVKDIMGISDDADDMVPFIKQLLLDNKGDVAQVVPMLFQ